MAQQGKLKKKMYWLKIEIIDGIDECSKDSTKDVFVKYTLEYTQLNITLIDKVLNTDDFFLSDLNGSHAVHYKTEN